ncbi:MAG: ABC transporter ATP-binding protein [Anaerolineaceae bacterium]
MNASELLAFSEITYCYPSAARPVMECFNLDITPGTVTAILGPNGAGKTTLLHLALGWLRPRSGLVSLGSRPLAGYTRHELGRWMALVPQSERISFEYSLLEYVLLGRAPYMPPLAMPRKEDYAIASDALNQVGLIELQERSILSLSGGERQLVLVARALTQQPRLLLLDEPTSHLDLKNKGRLLHLLKQLSARGVTILFTTHEPEVASALATHLVLMQNGKVLETGPLEQVYTSESLSHLYQLPVEVVSVSGRRIALWT